MGLERVVMKQRKLVGYFVADQQSNFYQSEVFTKVLNFVQTHSQIVKMKEKKTRNGLRLIITFEHIISIEKALQALRYFQK
jgi:transcription-repair coupling factor (superfamily II helicase)